MSAVTISRVSLVTCASILPSAPINSKLEPIWSYMNRGNKAPPRRTLVPAKLMPVSSNSATSVLLVIISLLRLVVERPDQEYHRCRYQPGEHQHRGQAEHPVR